MPPEVPGQPSRTIGHWCGTPVKISGWHWLPWAQLVTWLALVLASRPERASHSLGENALVTLILHGCEWAHNLAHAATARLLGKPADEILVIGGMSRLVYRELNDLTVTPQQHIGRALGGPLFNSFLLLLSAAWQRIARPKTLSARLARVAVQTNLFLSTISLLPVPGIDGGPLLKWGLVWRGKTPQQADCLVQQVNLGLSPLLTVASAWQFRKRHPLWGVFLTLLALSSLVIGMGWIQEEKVRLPGQGGGQ